MRDKIEKQYMEAVNGMNKEIMLMLEDNKASASVHVKNKILSYYICSELLGCGQREFFRATGLQPIHNGLNEIAAKKRITSSDKLMINEIKRQLNEKDFSVRVDSSI